MRNRIRSGYHLEMEDARWIAAGVFIGLAILYIISVAIQRRSRPPVDDTPIIPFTEDELREFGKPLHPGFESSDPPVAEPSSTE